MVAHCIFSDIVILFASAAIVSMSPTQVKTTLKPDPSLGQSVSHTTSAVSVSENVENADDPSNYPESVLKDSKSPEVYSLHIWSEVKFRYATTFVTSRVVNRGSQAAEVSFQFVLPENAFISGFLMEVKGKVYKAYVKEKKEAEKEYKAAIQRGQTAAHVAVSARDSNLFAVSVNLEPHSKMTFNLTYEELLSRRHGVYDHVIHLVTCDQVIQDMKVEVHINESQNITLIKVPEPNVGNEVKDAVSEGFVKVSRDSAKSAIITYAPTKDQQLKFLHLAKTENSLQPYLAEESTSQRLRVQYDVEHVSVMGHILLNDGYFVHFFAPSENSLNSSRQLNKHAIFVLDTSGSMSGRKIGQLQEAMELILDSLNENRDYFSIVQFSSSAKEWLHFHGELENRQRVHLATSWNINRAKAYIKRMEARGGTNIDEALRLALNIAAHRFGDESQDGRSISNGSFLFSPQPIIIFLTDGQPTHGVTSLSKILTAAREHNSDTKAPIFSLAFGNDADFGFLKKLSLQNYAFSRKIYEAADAALQLESFFQEISSPLLNNITFSYISPNVEQSSLTKSTFHTYFAGTEVVVAGRVKDISTYPEELGAFVTSSDYQVPVSVHSDGIVEEPHRVKTSKDASAGRLQVETGSEGKEYAIKFSPTQTLGKEIQEHKIGSLERLWAFLTIRQLLDRNLATERESTSIWPSHETNEGEESISQFKQKALQLSLQYGFVTPLTSLVVVKPLENDSVDGVSNSGTINRDEWPILHSAATSIYLFGIVKFLSIATVALTLARL